MNKTLFKIICDNKDDETKKPTLYVIKMTSSTECFYKVGITSFQDTKTRYRSYIGYDVEEIYKFTHPSSDLIMDLEAECLARSTKYIPSIKFGGFTEAIEDITEISKFLLSLNWIKDLKNETGIITETKKKLKEPQERVKFSWDVCVELFKLHLLNEDTNWKEETRIPAETRELLENILALCKNDASKAHYQISRYKNATKANCEKLTTILKNKKELSSKVIDIQKTKMFTKNKTEQLQKLLNDNPNKVWTNEEFTKTLEVSSNYVSRNKVQLEAFGFKFARKEHKEHKPRLG